MLEILFRSLFGLRTIGLYFETSSLKSTLANGNELGQIQDYRRISSDDEKRTVFRSIFPIERTVFLLRKEFRKNSAKMIDREATIHLPREEQLFHHTPLIPSRSAYAKSATELPQMASRAADVAHVASSAAACASLRRNRCTASTALISWRPGKRAVAVAERNLCRPRRCHTSRRVAQPRAAAGRAA